MKHSTQKRFIAGAICPKCHLMDKLVVYSTHEGDFAECVRCGYEQSAVEEKKADANTLSKNGKKRKVVWLKPQAQTE